MTTAPDDTYARFPQLATLPTLVRLQRRLETKLVPLEPILEREKAVRQEIDALLVACGFASNEGVTCRGYDVKHHARAGASRLNQDKLIESLVAAGVDRAFLESAIVAATEHGDACSFATVKPMKGAQVRRARRAS